MTQPPAPQPAWRVTRQELAPGFFQYGVRHAGEELGAALVSVPDRGPAHFTGLYVVPAWRGQGIARALLAHIVTAHAASGLHAHAAPYGTRGLSRRALAAFYRRHGAIVSRRYACHWPAGRMADRGRPTGGAMNPPAAVGLVAHPGGVA